MAIAETETVTVTGRVMGGDTTRPPLWCSGWVVCRPAVGENDKSFETRTEQHLQWESAGNGGAKRPVVRGVGGGFVVVEGV